MDYRIISIGALSHHDLWDTQGSARTAHATTTLIRSGDKVILVDPSLPAQILTARLGERVGLEPTAVTEVFLTNFRPAHRWGLSAFEHANWLIAEAERESVGRRLVERFQEQTDDDAQQLIKTEIELLQRCQSAPDQIAEHVDLFPLPGYTPGTCGLLLLETSMTTLVAGDAVPTMEHLSHGQVLRGAFDPDAARTSFIDAVEIADAIIPGHDNLLINPTRRM